MDQSGVRGMQGHVSWSSRRAAFLIDVQSFDGMDRADARAYGAVLGAKLREFREAGIPVVWVAIAPGGAWLLRPDQDAGNGLRDRAVLDEMGFAGHQDTFSNHDLYAAFLEEHGPRENEAVYRKPSMSALASPEDARDRDRILEEAGIKPESRREDTDHPAIKYIQPGEEDQELHTLFQDRETLRDYLGQAGVAEADVLGAVSKYCVAETGDTRSKGQQVWAGFDHRSLISETIAGALQERSFSPEERARIAVIAYSTGPARTVPAAQSSPGGLAMAAMSQERAVEPVVRAGQDLAL